jgi:hypothetical protein
MEDVFNEGREIISWNREEGAKMTTKVVVAQNLGLDEHEQSELKKLGEVVFYDELAKNPDEWLKRCEGADVI